jgi:hypothetical protein
MLESKIASNPASALSRPKWSAQRPTSRVLFCIFKIFQPTPLNPVFSSETGLAKTEIFPAKTKKLFLNPFTK